MAQAARISSMPTAADDLPSGLRQLEAAMRREPFRCEAPEIRITGAGYVAQYSFDCRVQIVGTFGTENEALRALAQLVASWEHEAEATADETAVPAMPTRRRRAKPVDPRQRTLLLPVSGGVSTRTSAGDRPAPPAERVG